MAPVIVDPARVREFEDADAFYAWLARNHDREPEVWIKIHKKGSGLKSINHIEAIETVLCWGWIDAIRKGFDDKSFLQRYVPRGKKSTWSQVNVDNIARLIADGRMTEHGLKQVEAAKADGRWDAAYRIKGSTVPDDLQAAIEADPQARAFFATLTAQNRFALIFRLQALKTEAGRAKRIAATVEMLRKGETVYPQGKG
ncbi:YdeI family protein [Brevundimonas sp.]|uniref:YdeI/OmpD-associated family protein n=1 Tax=Brevundimonas sp. TaxID=1871086 RepID=UPI0025B8D7AA|nr:YdeI/OmpD-associated family protein [Brevundimonas sp.]